MKRTHLKQKGFTLTELMIVVALAAIFATLAVPNMGGMIARQRVQGQANEIANAFTFAHTEAVRRGKPVFVVPATVKDDGKFNGVAANWTSANALFVFTDNDKGKNDQTYISKDGDEDLRLVPLNAQIKLAEISKEELGKDITKTHKADMAFIYYSNGQMRLGKVDSSDKKVSATEPSGAIGRVMMKHNKRATKNQVSRFCEVIRVNATGRATVYTGKRTDLNKNKDDFFYCE